MIVFAGPSLAGEDLSGFSGVTIRPPAKQGDVYLASLENPRAIGIVDGYFEGVPSVWHKEVLWALSQGIAVLGAASMGALRAAELDCYGMIGVGEIYRAYRDGGLEDDDEVALVHGPEEVGYVSLSEAMVNVRATCAAAVQAGVVSPEQSTQIVETAKAAYYKDRTWETIFAGVPASLLDHDTRSAIAGWVANNKVDQKRRDALALLHRMASGDIAATGEPRFREFRFEHTALWQRNTVSWRQAQEPAARDAEIGYRLVSDEQLYWRPDDDGGEP